MFTLAIPVVVAELGWITMGMVDILMVGRLGAEAIGAVGIGTAIFNAVCVFSLGMLLGLDTLVSQAFGARRLDECHHWLIHGVVLSAVLTIPTMLLLLAIGRSLDGWGMDPEVLRLTHPYVDAVIWSVPPLLLYFCFRRYLQGMGSVRPVMIALVVANAANVVVNWVLIFGHFGFPAMGVAGAAWATVLSRAVMCAYLMIAIVYRERGRRPGLFETPLRIQASSMWRLVSLGTPAALQLTLEVGVFAAGSALAGRLTPTALAAHQIALNLAGFTFMVPLGIASAGAVRVGHAIGARDGPAASRAGWTALLFGTTFMSCAAAIFLLVPRTLDRRLQLRSGRTGHRRRAACGRRRVSALRWPARRRHGHPSRARRYAYADVVEPRGALDARPAGRVPPGLPHEARRHRSVVGTLDRPDYLRRRADDRLVATHQGGADFVRRRSQKSEVRS